MGAEEPGDVALGGQVGQIRKMLLVDVKKAHLNPNAASVLILFHQGGAAKDKVGKLRRWLCGL